MRRTRYDTPAAKKIHDAWGDETVARVRSNPYALAEEVRGFGFLEVRQTGIPDGRHNFSR